MNSRFDSPHHWSPKTNVFISETGDLIIKVTLSGVGADDIEVTAEGNRLGIRGVRRDLEASNSRQLLVNEIPAGPFESVLEVPDSYDVTAFLSTYENGMLRIVVPLRRR